VRILPSKLCPSWHTINFFPILFSDASLEAVFVLDWQCAICILGKDDGPNTKIISFTLVRFSVPVVEISKL
jgi:hypothetical protein